MDFHRCVTLYIKNPASCRHSAQLILQTVSGWINLKSSVTTKSHWATHLLRGSCHEFKMGNTGIKEWTLVNTLGASYLKNINCPFKLLHAFTVLKCLMLNHLHLLLLSWMWIVKHCAHSKFDIPYHESAKKWTTAHLHDGDSRWQIYPQHKEYT